jgi:hypothetical protein
MSGTHSPDPSAPSSPAEFFGGHPEGLAIYAAVAAMIRTIGECEERVSRSQVAFRRRRGFAFVWRPAQYVRSDVPAVLSIATPRRLESPRFKEVVHPAPGTWMHHLEVREPAAIDAEVREWLRLAYDSARA